MIFWRSLVQVEKCKRKLKIYSNNATQANEQRRSKVNHKVESLSRNSPRLFPFLLSSKECYHLIRSLGFFLWLIVSFEASRTQLKAKEESAEVATKRNWTIKCMQMLFFDCKYFIHAEILLWRFHLPSQSLLLLSPSPVRTLEIHSLPIYSNFDFFVSISGFYLKIIWK